MTRQEVLVILLDVFRERGFEGATISEIAKATGLGKATLYHHFPGGKEQMLEAIVEDTLKQLDEDVFAPLRVQGDARARLINIVDGWNQYLDGGARNCTLAVLTLGTARSKVGDRVSTQVESWLNQLQRLYEDAGSTRKRAVRSARELLLRIQGAVVLSRMLGSDDTFVRTRKRLVKEIESL